MNSPRVPCHPARSFLYVPGDRPDRLAKSVARGADAVVADLEDAVLPDAKNDALEHVKAWLSRAPHREPGIEPTAWVRINSGRRGLDEVRALAPLPALAGIFIPKVESPAEVDAVRGAAHAVRPNGVLLAPMIESAAGAVRLLDIAQAAGVHQLHIGEIDLAADLNLEPSDNGTELLHVRSQVVVASRYAGLQPPSAPVSAVLDDPDRYRSETVALRRLGFFGRDCIHPAQVEVAAKVFSPTPQEQAWARDLLDHARHSPGAFRAPDGTMVDEAVLRKARRVLGLDGYR